MRRRRTARGHALVETGLGIILLVTIVVFGIHFSEVAFLSMKVHEAAASAIWDSTAYRVHRIGAMYDSGAVASPTAQGNAQGRYSDYDAIRNGGAPTQALTRAEALSVRCQKDGAVAYALAGARVPGYGEPNGVSCAVEGGASVVNFPESFLDDSNGIFTEVNYALSAPIKLCGMGRAAGGACGGQLSILLGDYGFTDGPEGAECPRRPDSPDNSCPNFPFYNLTNDLWERSFGWTGRPEQFARDVTDTAPTVRITGFYLSFKGEGTFAEAADPRWQTSPMNQRISYWQTYSARSGMGSFRYLGKYDCN